MDPSPPSSVRRPLRRIHPRLRASPVRIRRPPVPAIPWPSSLADPVIPASSAGCLHPHVVCAAVRALRTLPRPPARPAVAAASAVADSPVAKRAAARPHLRPSRRPSSAAVRLPSARPSAVRAAPGLRFLCAARCRPPLQPPRVAPPLSRRAAGSAPACRRPRLQLLSGLQRPLLLHQLELFSASSASKHLDLPYISACLAILANQPASILWAAPIHCHLLPVAIAAACC